MAKATPAATVVLAHPSGRFNVKVAPARAVVLEGRGYTRIEVPAPKRTAKPKEAP